MQKTIDSLHKSIQDKDLLIQKLTSQTNQMNTQSQIKMSLEDVESQTEISHQSYIQLSIEQIEHFEYYRSHTLLTSIEPIPNTNNELIEKLSKEIEMMKIEKQQSEEKTIKLKKGIEEIQKRFEVELEKKERKSLMINQSNSKLFADISNKNNELALELKKATSRCMILSKAKYDIENIALKQETKIKEFEQKMQNAIINKNSNNISGIISKHDIYSSHKHLLPSTHKLKPINAFKKFHLKTSSENNQTLNLDESIH